MSQPGQGAKATAAQRTEVGRLRAEGVSIRLIAARVFGDARYRGRVERILRHPAGTPLRPGPGADDAPEAVEVPDLEGIAMWRWMLERTRAALAARPKPPSAAEIRSLLDVELRLQQMEALERARERSRERRSSR